MAKRSILKAVATVTVFSVITRCLSFIFKIYLSRTVGAEIIGLYQISLSVFFLFSALSSSGLPTVLSRKIAEDRAVGEDRAARFFTGALIIVAFISVFTALVLGFTAPYLKGLFSDDRALPLFRIMLPALVSTGIYSVIRGWFWGNKRFTEYSVTETLEEVLRILFTLLFISGVIGGIQGAYGIALAFTVSDIAVAIILVILFFVKGGRLKKKPLLKEIAVPALPLTAMRVFGSFVGTVVALILPARLIASGMSVAEATASIGRIAGMANPLLFAPNAIISSLIIVLIPEMSENGITGNNFALNQNINKGISFSLIISGLFLFLLFALGEPLTELLYNDTASGQYLSAAAYLMLFMPINQMTASTLNSIGMEKESFLTFAIGTALLIFSIYFLPKYLGIYAVVVANLLSLLTSVAGNLSLLHRRIKLDFKFLKTFFAVAVFTVPCAYLAKTMYSLCGSTYYALPIAALISAIMYVVLCFVFGLIKLSYFSFWKKSKQKKTNKTATV